MIHLQKFAEDILKYPFENIEFLTQALRHRSCLEDFSDDSLSNERLEFLGDRILGAAISDLLYRLFDQESEGNLSKFFVTLVRQETLSQIAQELNLGDYMFFGKSEKMAKGSANPALLANCLEAIIAAIYMDGGFQPAYDFVKRFWLSYIYHVKDLTYDPKSLLQEWVQSKNWDLPVYKTISCQGPDHAPIFTVQVMVHGDDKNYSAQASGPSKRKAAQCAASDMLKNLKNESFKNIL